MILRRTCALTQLSHNSLLCHFHSLDFRQKISSFSSSSIRSAWKSERPYARVFGQAKKSKINQETVKDKAAREQCGEGPFDLNTWRRHTRDNRWYWGSKGATEESENKWLEAYTCVTPESIADGASQVLQTRCPAQKCAVAHNMWRAIVDTPLPIGNSIPPDYPARPDKPEVVPSREIPKPKESGLPLNVYMLLNLAHVELNAIDIACDTVVRFSYVGLPREFYVDFAHVAEDESRHFGWCMQRLKELGYSYGDMVAHGMLWDGAIASSGDVMARLVIGPCSQEARGLDAGPRLVERLMSMNDQITAAIVHQISREELAHVAVGAFWFRELCEATGTDLGTTFRSWLHDLCPDMLNGQFNHMARNRAGLEQSWYDKQLWQEEDHQKLDQVGHSQFRSMTPLQMEGLQSRLSQLMEIEASMSSQSILA